MRYMIRSIIWCGLRNIGKWVLRGDIQDRVGNTFEEISQKHDFEMDTLEIAEDHVCIFLSFPLSCNPDTIFLSKSG